MLLHAYFQGLLKNIVFRSVALVTEKLWAILDFFFTDRTFFRPVSYPINLEKYVLTKNPLNYYLLKVTKFHGDSFKTESARSKKLEGERQTPA